MTSYIITITPEGPGSAQTATLRVRTTEDQAFLTEVHVQADPGLADSPILGIDFGLLVRAVSGARSSAGIRSTVDAPAAATGGATPSRRVSKPRTGEKRTRAAAPPAPAPASGDRTRKEVRGRTAERDSDARVYRRLPDDFVTVYQKTGGATATARHYGVPRHTVQGWLRRLRQEGILPTSR